MTEKRLPFDPEHPDVWEIDQSGQSVLVESFPFEMVFVKGQSEVIIYEGDAYYKSGELIPRDKVPSQIIDRLDPIEGPEEEILMKDEFDKESDDV